MLTTPIDPRTVLSANIDSSVKEPDKAKSLKELRESTREFEALFINEMFKAMRKTIPEGGLFEKDLSDEIYEGMIDMERARHASKGKGIGLGEQMYDQLKHLIANKKS